MRTKVISLITILFTLASCNMHNKHLHDGVYQYTLKMFGAQLPTNSITIDGDKIILNSTGMSSHCTQYEDRIEIDHEDNTTATLYFNERGSLMMNNLEFERIQSTP